jgi:hypothetical protein
MENTHFNQTIAGPDLLTLLHRQGSCCAEHSIYVLHGASQNLEESLKPTAVGGAPFPDSKVLKPHHLKVGLQIFHQGRFSTTFFSGASG